MADGNKITAQDLLDVQGIENAINNITNGLNGIDAKLKELAKGVKIDIVSAGSVDEIQKLVPAVQALSNATDKLKTAKEQHNQVSKTFTGMNADEANALGTVNAMLKKGMREQAAITAQYRQNGASVAYLTEVTRTLKKEIESIRSSENGHSAGLGKLQSAYKELQRALETTKISMVGVDSEIKNNKNLTNAQAIEINKLREAMRGSAQDAINAANGYSLQGRSVNELKAAQAALQERLKSMSMGDAGFNELGSALDNVSRALKLTQEAALGTRVELNQNAKLTDAQVAKLEQFKAAIQGTIPEILQATNKLKIEDMTYNQLQATYTALVTRMKNIPQGELAKQDAAKVIASAKQMRDAMNTMQQSMGNATLNVGNYRSAFDGLGFSIQQVLREVPSAININQFFLAISNNIPMVVDQMKAFRKQQADIKVEMEGLEKLNAKNSARYKQLMEQQMSMGKKFLTSILNWQTALIAALFALRKYGGDIVDWFVKKITDLSVQYNTFKKAIKDGDIGKNVSLIHQLQSEWATLADDEKNKWLETNKTNFDQLGVSIKNVNDFEEIMINNAKSVYDASMQKAKATAVLALANEKMTKAATKAAKAELLRQSAEKGEYPVWVKILGGLGSFEGFKYVSPDETRIKMMNKRADALDKRAKKLEDTAGDYYDYYEELYNFIANDFKKGGGKGRTYNQRTFDDMYSEYLEARANLAKDQYDRELEMVDVRNAQEIEKLKNKYKKEQDNLEFNLRHQFITQQEYKKSLADLERNYNTIIESEKNKYYLELTKLNDRYIEKYGKKLSNQYKDEAKEIDVALLKIKKRVVTSSGEIANNNIVNANIANLRNQIIDIQRLQAEAIAKAEEEAMKGEIVKYHEQKLKSLREEYNFLISNYPNDEERINRNINNTEVTIDAMMNAADAIRVKGKETSDELGSEIDKINAKLQNQVQLLNFTKQLQGYKSVWDMLGKGDKIGIGKANDKKGWMTTLFGDQVSELDEQGIENLFDQWQDSLTEALKGIADEVKDMLSDMIDAWVEYYEKKAELAAEATSVAQEAYEHEKSLLDAGYANSVETTWAEYQTKKALQKKAEQDAEKAAQVQAGIDSLTASSSLVTAIANIMKLYTNIPGGVAISASVIAGLLASFFKYKASVSSIKTYGDGGYETFSGGSHASGHDINMGIQNGQGKTMHAEGGESLGIFNKRANAKYGSLIPSVVNSINNGTYNADALADISRQRKMSEGMMMMNNMYTRPADLTTLERGLDRLNATSESRMYVDANGNLIEKVGSLTRIHKR